MRVLLRSIKHERINFFIFTFLGLITNDKSIGCRAFEVGNDPDCPCLNFVHNDTDRIDGNESCLNAKIVFDKDTNIHETFCYPESYGVGCGNHDLILEPYCDGDNNNPSFCDRAFCYIDPDLCHSSTTSTYAKSIIFPHLYYSYTACGDEDSFRNFNAESELTGRTIKVGLPGIYYPDHYRVDEEGNPIIFSDDINEGKGDLKGVFIDFLQSLAMDGNFNVEFHPVSLGSYVGKEWDQWGGCISDVSRGILDLCLGKFWETSFRRRMAPFSTSVFNDNYILMVRRPRIRDDLWTQFELVFEPFTPKLWIVIVGVTFLVGIAYTILGPDRNSSSSMRYVKFSSSDIAENIYFAWSELVQGADSSGVKTTAQRSVALTWSLFILIIIAAYTANLAAFLGKEKVLFEVKDINDCMRKNCLVCYPGSKVFEDALTSYFPALQKKAVDNIRVALDKLEERECDAIMMSEYNWNLNSKLWRECEAIFTGQSVITFNVAWPMSPSISRGMSYWISRSLEHQGFERIVDVYRSPQKCSSRLDLEVEEDVPQLDVASMTGPLLFLATGILFGVMLKYGGRPKKRFIHEEEISLDSPDDEKEETYKSSEDDSEYYNKDLYLETNKVLQEMMISDDGIEISSRYY